MVQTDHNVFVDLVLCIVAREIIIEEELCGLPDGLDSGDIYASDQLYLCPFLATNNFAIVCL